MIDELRQRYLSQYAHAASDVIALMAYRHLALMMNETFIFELSAFNAMPAAVQDFHRVSFRNRWGFCPTKQLVLLHLRKRSVTVESFKSDRIVNVMINMQYSKNDILKEIGILYDASVDFESRTNKADYIPSDLTDIERSLKVFDLKKSMSWADLSKYFNTSVDSVRNWFRCGKKLVRQGIPSFPAFPIPEK